MTSVVYKTGTISVANGSTTVTGMGTAFVASARVGSEIFVSGSRVGVVQAVVSDIELTLFTAYDRTTLTGVSYELTSGQPVRDSFAAAVASALQAFDAKQEGPLSGRFGDGTVALPGIAFLSDLDNGFYRPGADRMAASKKFEAPEFGGLGVTQSATDATAGKVMTVGAGGLLSSEVPALTDLDAAAPAGFYQTGSGYTGGPVATGTFGDALLRMARSNGAGRYSMFMARTTDRVFFSRKANDAAAWSHFEMWHKSNTTVDGSGFVMEASPVLRLFGDGTSTEPVKPVGATVTREGLGHYTITGAPPLASKGWKVRAPQDENGGVLVKVAAMHHYSGALHVHTTDVNDAPADIPADAFVMLRFWEAKEEGETPPDIVEVTAQAHDKIADDLRKAGVNAERDRRLGEGVVIPVSGYGDIHVQGRPNDQVNLIAVGDTAKDLIAAGVTGPIIPFRDAQNVMHDLTPVQAAELVRLGKEAATAIYQTSWDIKDGAIIADDYADDSHWP